MKVKVLRSHNNAYGNTFEKVFGDEYELPAEHAAPLIAAGLIEDAPETPAKLAGKGTAKTVSGDDAEG